MTDLIATQCPICLSDSDDRQVYEASFQPEQLNPEIFSPRRIPDQLHYRMVICRRCGLMRADPALSSRALAAFYTASRSHEVQLAQDAVATYIKYFHRYFADVPSKSQVLEVGCGNGDFLRALLRNNFNNIDGVEPSLEAVAQAHELKRLIYNGMLGPGIYPSSHFDLICAFHVFDHLCDPGQFLRDCGDYLKSRGRLFLIIHDINAWPAQVLGQACPIIDIEHPFLYNKVALTRLLEANGFEVQKSFQVYNCYPLRYWVQLTPLANIVKKRLLAYLQRSRLGRIPLTLGAGNIGIIARKKDE